MTPTTRRDSSTTSVSTSVSLCTRDRRGLDGGDERRA
jgi:hypothetical protein